MQTTQDYKTLPQIERSNMKVLWHNSYYDGPINGMMEYNSKKCYFEKCDDFLDHPEMVTLWENDELPPWYRRYVVYELTDDQIVEEDYWHNLFREFVGTHTDHQPGGSMKPKSQHHHFYSRYKEKKTLILSNEQKIGWFESLMLY